MDEVKSPKREVEWPTLGLLALVYAGWAVSVFWLPLLWLPLAILGAIVTIALHSSLTHEAVHGHPFRNARLNEATVFFPLSLFVPYGRFRDLHLAHHVDSILTDPYDDPESNYMDPAVWGTLPKWVQTFLRMNNTLAGRMVLGPAISIVCLIKTDWSLIRGGDDTVRETWILHVLGLLPVFALVIAAPMPVWAYLVAAYAGFSILKIRTFLEHRAHDKTGGRTVVIEDKGPLALIFLNNNLHVVHHMHPSVAWYRLPRLFQANRDKYLRRNDGYYYRSYAQIFARHFLRAKDPVPHPLMQDQQNRSN